MRTKCRRRIKLSENIDDARQKLDELLANPRDGYKYPEEVASLKQQLAYYEQSDDHKIAHFLIGKVEDPKAKKDPRMCIVDGKLVQSLSSKQGFQTELLDLGCENQ